MTGRDVPQSGAGHRAETTPDTRIDPEPLAMDTEDVLAALNAYEDGDDDDPGLQADVPAPG